jgi:hypothetical protein
LQPIPRADPKEIARLIGELDSPRFPVREMATVQLEGLDAQTEGALRSALQGKPTPEARRRMESLLKNLAAVPNAQLLRQLRAIEALERLATPQARALIREVAGGAPDARLTREANAALRRLNTHPGP